MAQTYRDLCIFARRSKEVPIRTKCEATNAKISQSFTGIIEKVTKYKSIRVINPLIKM